MISVARHGGGARELDNFAFQDDDGLKNALTKASPAPKVDAGKIQAVDVPGSGSWATNHTCIVVVVTSSGPRYLPPGKRAIAP
jgi:hypothetical protein